MTGSNNTDQKNLKSKRLAKMVQMVIAKRKLKAMGIVIVGVTPEEVVEFYKWIVSERSKQ